MINVINSPHNPNFKRWSYLATSKGIKKYGQFLLCGSKLVSEALPSHSKNWELLLTPEMQPSFLPQFTGKVFQLPPALFKKIDILGTHTPLLVGPCPKVKKWDISSPQGLEILTPLGDPTNLGALIRSGQAFNVSKIILLQESAHPFHPKTLRASAATALKAPLFYGPSLHELAAMSQNSSFFTLDKSGQNIFKFQWPQHLHLLVGEEGQGLPFTSKNALAIPLANQVESLNAVAAVSVALSCRQVQI